jgi:hypothetical protein
VWLTGHEGSHYFDLGSESGPRRYGPLSSLLAVSASLTPANTTHSELKQIGVRPVGADPDACHSTALQRFQSPAALEATGSNETSRGLSG